MTAKTISPGAGFPWVLVLTGKQCNGVHLVRDEADLLQRMMAEGLLELRLLGIGTSSDHNEVIVERADAARNLLSKVAEEADTAIEGYLNLRHGQFEIVLHFRRSGNPPYRLRGSGGLGGAA